MGTAEANAWDQGETPSSNVWEEKKQKSACRDPIFAVLFYANIITMAVLAAVNGSSPFKADDDSNISYEGFMYTAFASGAFSFILSGVMFLTLLCIPGFLIKAALIFNVIATGVAAAASFVWGGTFAGIIMSIFFLLMCCYAWAVWSRIPFATANLVTGTTAIKSNFGVILLSYLSTVLAFGWTALWCTVLVGSYSKQADCQINEDGVEECGGPNYLILFLLFISYFFTHQVLQNTTHVIVAGVVGTWWFVPEEAKGCCSSAVIGSTIRSVTTSFGSICFGSLIVAVLQALRQLVETAKQNDDINNVLACCLDCIIGCLEGIMEYFNKWAYVYVGLYGYGYCEAGKNVMQLFKDRGWDAIIADDLIGMVLAMLSLVVGLITGAVALIYEQRTDWFDAYEANGGTNPDVLSFIIGLIVGLVICGVMLSAVASAVNAVIVLFAEGPAEFEQHYPKLSRKMRDAYGEAHPESFNSTYNN